MGPVAPGDHLARPSGRASGARAASSSRRPGTAWTCSENDTVRTIIERGLLWAAAEDRHRRLWRHLRPVPRDSRADCEPACLTAVADLAPDRAAVVADALRGAVRMSVEALVDAPEVDLVLNLTMPAAHADVALMAIARRQGRLRREALAATTAEAADGHGRAPPRPGSASAAPPTPCSALAPRPPARPWMTGLIGRPIAATATMVTPGHELWHPNPDFYYQPGGGPLMDMGPYYVTALVTILGPVVTTLGAASRTRSTRTIATGPRAGEVIPVDVDSHVTGVLVHESGVLSTLVMSFDAVASRAARIEMHGEAATLEAPDPNQFEGDVLVRHIAESDWVTLPPSAGYLAASRGYGIADLAATPAGVRAASGCAPRLPCAGHHGVAARVGAQRSQRRRLQQLRTAGPGRCWVGSPGHRAVDRCVNHVRRQRHERAILHPGRGPHPVRGAGLERPVQLQGLRPRPAGARQAHGGAPPDRRLRLAFLRLAGH